MQCPQTPLLDSQQDHAFPHHTAHVSGTARDRTVAKRHYAWKRHSGSRPGIGDDRNLSDGLSEVYAGHHKPVCTVLPITNSLSTPLVRRDTSDEAFESGSTSSTAAFKFHDAARRLALSPLSTNTRKHINEEDVFECLSSYGHNTFESYGLRSRYSPMSTKYTDNKICFERDITSARKESLYKQYCSYGTSPTILATSNPCANGSPRPFHQLVTRSMGQGKSSGPCNFSRPRPMHSVLSSPVKPRRPNFSRPLHPKHEPALVTSVRCPRPSQGDRFDDEAIRQASLQNGGVSSQKAGNSDSAVPVHLALNGNLASIGGQPATGASPDDPVRRSFDSAVAECLGDRRLQLSRWEIWLQRILLSFFVFGVNIALGLAYLGSFKHPYLLAILVFMKSKDILSTIADVLGLLHNLARKRIWPPKSPDPRWILSLVCAYAETEEQIMKTVYSLARGKTQPHNQAICIILDGKLRNIVTRMSAINITVHRPYTTWRGNQGEIVVSAGHLENIPLILVQKAKNAGKKDSLILGHDLFNFPRDDMPQSTQMLRKEVWRNVLPAVIPTPQVKFDKFDFVFCTDADSTIHDLNLRRLADALCEEDNAIAGCGVLFAEFGSARMEYSPWHLFQQFQYTFGQYVRRQAESFWGRVTCLPGCNTMIVVRPEMGRAISQYAKPVTEHNLFRHQVQYLGTDRRLTWCMMAQGKHLRTIFVPDALSETVVPDGISHYLSQRRRWASNAYFNDFFYLFGPRQRLVTRLFAAIDIVRLTLVYYRVFNTGYFLYGLITNFYVIKIIPTLIVTKTPATWYLLLVLTKEPFLRQRLHKILLGMCINQIISPILSVIVFTNVLLHIGSQAWGKTGASTQGSSCSTANVTTISIDNAPPQKWTPKRLAHVVRTAIRDMTPKRRKATSSPKPSMTTRKLGSTSQTISVTPRLLRGTRPSSSQTNSDRTNGASTIGTPCHQSDEEDSSQTLPTIFTPISNSQQKSSLAPMTLMRRTPYRCERAQPDANASTGSPVRLNTDSAAVLTYED